MIAEAKQSYRGVICIHCHQPTPLTPSAESKEQKHRDGAQGAEDEFAIFSNPLRCRNCGKEAVYRKRCKGFRRNSAKTATQALSEFVRLACCRSRIGVFATSTSSR